MLNRRSFFAAIAAAFAAPKLPAAARHILATDPAKGVNPMFIAYFEKAMRPAIEAQLFLSYTAANNSMCFKVSSQIFDVSPLKFYPGKVFPLDSPDLHMSYYRAHSDSLGGPSLAAPTPPDPLRIP